NVVTDGDGVCRLPVNRDPIEDWELYIEIQKEGYALQFAAWSSLRGDAVEDIPTEYTTRLMRGATVGGVIVNEQGDPVSGARVVLSVLGPAPAPGAPRQREGAVTGTAY